MRLIRLTSLFFLFTTVYCFGQTSLPDSLKQRFAGATEDSLYVDQLNSLATSYLKTNPTASRQIASHSSEVASKIKFTRGFARSLTVIGNSYWYEGVYEFAQNYYLLAARQYNAISDSIGLGQVYNNIGEVNKRLGEYKKSLDYLLQSMRLKEKDSSSALTIYNIGELYLTMRNYAEAKKYIDESLEIARARKDERVLAYDYWTLARINSHQGLNDLSFPYFKQAEELWIKLGETRSLIQTYQDLAEALRNDGQLKKATSYLDKASYLASLINVPDLRITNYHGYFKVDSAAGNYQSAMYYLSRHNTLKDSVYNLLKAEQIARVQTIYETEMREREYQQLKTEKSLKDEQIKSREISLAAISIGLIVVGVLAYLLFRQRAQILNANKNLHEKNEEIHNQKEALEVQAVALIKLNEALQDLNRTLENRIEERSIQLLLQNQKLAEYTFVNAHKLRAPVASLLGLIHLMSKVKVEERETIIQHIKTCGDELDMVIKDISKNLEGAIVKEQGYKTV
jgi:tetratricopeptide (TPR) repeat protein